MHSALQQYPDSDTQLALLDPQGAARQRLATLLPVYEGYKLFPQRDIEGILLLLKRGEINIVFIHCQNNLVECRRAIEKIHQVIPNIPILITGPELTDTQAELLQAVGAADYLPLPSMTKALLTRAMKYAINDHRQRQQIHQLTRSDPLTSVSNRGHFYSNLLNRLDQQKIFDYQLILFNIDLDGFNDFNLQYGPAAGDIVVRELSHRLHSLLGENDLLARLGSDEFTILLHCEPNADCYDQAKKYGSRLLNKLTAPYRYDGKDHILPCSIGIALAPRDGDKPDELSRRASLARSEAKLQHGCSYTIFSIEMEDQILAPTELESEIYTALRANQFKLFYQPRIDLKTGRICGAEALIRWQHPERDLLMPDQFIPLAEHTGLIVPIGYWVIHSAGQALKSLRKEGLLEGRLGINLSFRQFKDDNMASTITRIIQQQKIDTSLIEFELTETALFTDELHVRTCIEQLSGLGIDFSLDDFGTGYSSFALLQKLPIHTLKIDRSFIRNVDSCADDAEIVRAIINLAHNLDMLVIAEGVETAEQLNFLREHDCDQVQGFFFSRPVPFEDFRQQLLEDQASHSFAPKLREV